jgi:hypothetical protein
MGMRTTAAYVVAGAVLGALAGLAVDMCISIYAHHMWLSLLLAGAAGAAAAGAGAVVMRTRRVAVRDPLLGGLLACGGYFLVLLVKADFNHHANVEAFSCVFFALVYSSAIAASHATAIGQRDFRFAAAFFASIGGLIALAAGVRILWLPTRVPTIRAVIAGALYGAFLWGSIAAARRIFSVDMERFRV